MTCVPVHISQAPGVSERETHVTSKDELAAAAADAASDLCDTDYRGLGDTHERIHQNREAGRPDSRGDVPRLTGQIKVGEIEVGNRALERAPFWRSI
jgi:hypothetical protein